MDLIEYKIVAKAPLLRCFLFILKLKAGDTITTGQYINYQSFSKLQFRTLVKKSFHRTHIDLKDTSGEKAPFEFPGINCFLLMFKKASSIYF